MFFRLLSIGLLLILLSACGDTLGGDPAQVLPPTFTTVPLPTVPPTLVPVATATSVPTKDVPTLTPAATSTLAATNTPVATETPQATATPLPTDTPAPPTITPLPPTPTIEAVTVGGKTGLKSQPFNLSGGSYAIDYTLKDNTGSSIGCYVGYIDLINVEPKTPNENHERISSMGFMDKDTFAETSYVYKVAPGTYYIDTTINTCEWSVTIRRP